MGVGHGVLVFRNGKRFAQHALISQSVYRIVYGINHGIVCYPPVHRVPGFAWKLRMIPVMVTIDQIKFLLHTGWAKSNDGTGDKALNAKIILQKIAHIGPVFMLQATEKFRPVMYTFCGVISIPLFVPTINTDISGLQRLACRQAAQLTTGL